MWKLIAGVLFLSVLDTCAASAQPGNLSQPASSTMFITECEEHGCNPARGTPSWSFSSKGNIANYGAPNQRITVTLEHLDPEAIAVRRVDPSGFTALYLGKITGDRIIGSVIYSPPNPGITSTSVWTGILHGYRASLETPTTAIPESGPIAPSRIVECEGLLCNDDSVYGIDWAFKGNEGIGRFNGSAQPLILEHATSNLIFVRRTDTTGPSAGQSALYMALRHGTQLTGAALYYDSHNPKSPRADFWYGVVENPLALMPETYAAGLAPTAMPQYLSLCVADGCGLHWTFTGSHGFAPRDQNVAADKLTLQSFTPTQVVVQSTGHDDPQKVSIYRGKLQGNRIVGTVESENGSTSPFSAVIPATSCTRTDGIVLGAQEAFDVAGAAFRFGRSAEGLKCVLLAARLGNPGAQYMAGTLYFKGMEPQLKPNLNESFYWMSKAAAQGQYKALRNLVHYYHDGIGTSPDESKATQWAAQANTSTGGRIEAANQSRADQNKGFDALAQMLILLMASDMSAPPSAERKHQPLCVEHSDLTCKKWVYP